MTQPINVALEEWRGSRVVRDVTQRYKRKAATDFQDAPAKLSGRQCVFYRNLIATALATGSTEIPVDFGLRNGRRVYLVRGCIKIAEHAGFVARIRNDSTGVVSSIRLNWDVIGQRRSA
jgi:hypothetical protein